MRKNSPDNERIKRRYFQYLKEAKRLSSASVDKSAAATALFEKSTGYKPFRQFHIEQAVAFKRRLAETVNPKTGKQISKATISSTLRALKAFFQWLSDQPGYRSRLSYSDAEYFNDSVKDSRVAHAVREGRSPTMEQALHALRSMPDGSEIEWRNRALFAFLLLTAARDGAIVSAKLKRIDLVEGYFDQDPRDVATKASKAIATYFFPVDPLALLIFEGWIKYLREVRHFGLDDPVFPSTRTGVDPAGQFSGLGVSRSHWANAGPVRRIVKKAFHEAGLPEFGPHSFRKTLTRFGFEKCERIVDLKAWSENLGHDHLITTTQSYGKLGPERQGEIMRKLQKVKPAR